ncbi:hypothetical protein DICVIV_10808 [Dictyocaulus viviparus]|uniref:Protection of telomeres protein 1 ssDNA-binding domain-containing protein n=1 Tax=Dictyocaulus viviparus TaxID=29172 RepID=A0A0D8XF39_DICVI|nr:hypothetical protein DICVIV_10808 [Dictyocaulus viviparus]
MWSSLIMVVPALELRSTTSIKGYLAIVNEYDSWKLVAFIARITLLIIIHWNPEYTELFAPCRNMFRADSDSIEIVYCEISKDLCHLIESYIIDVCCYGNWAEKATKLKIGDIVFLGNIRNYVCRSNRISAITLHEGGLRFNRALNVADRNDPKCFEISKRCADMLSLYPELGSGLLEGSSEEIVTPIINDEVHAQSSPKIILSKYQASKSMGNEFAESVGTRLLATSEACDGNIMLTDFSTEDSVIEQTVNNKVESFSTEEEVMDCQHHEEDSEDNLSDRETQDFLVELERDDRPDSNELSEIADFCDKIRHDLIEEFFERELAKLCEFDRNDKDLREEVEGILRMNVGERVSIVNYVEAELSFLAQESYLKNALLFTATCVKCGIEVIVERCSKNWCQICFEKHECLSIVQYSYRLVVPSIYAFDGAVGQLCLALDGNIWAALSSSDQLSVINVMQLYSEYDLTKFTEKLDNLLRSVEVVFLLKSGANFRYFSIVFRCRYLFFFLFLHLAKYAIMKKKKFSVKDGKLMALDRIKGSVLVFVDRCLVADRNC